MARMSCRPCHAGDALAEPIFEPEIPLRCYGEPSFEPEIPLPHGETKYVTVTGRIVVGCARADAVSRSHE